MSKIPNFGEKIKIRIFGKKNAKQIKIVAKALLRILGTLTQIVEIGETRRQLQRHITQQLVSTILTYLTGPLIAIWYQ